MEEQAMAEKNLILKVLVGSHLYGTNTPQSDTDYVGIFVPSKDYVLGLKKCEQVELRTNPSSSGKRNTKEDTDTVLYSLPKFIHLALQNNPNIIEILFAPKQNIIHITEEGQKLLDMRSLFVSQRVFTTFNGYAHAQKEKLYTKKDRLDALSEAYAQITHLLVNSLTHETSVLSNPFFVSGKYGKYKTYETGTQYGHIHNDLRELLGEYGNRTSSIEKNGYDTKFASHLIRLLTEGIQFLTEGQISLPLPNHELLRDIKLGKYSLEAVQEMTKQYEEQIKFVGSKNSLQKIPQTDAVNALQIEMLEKFWANAYNRNQ